METKSGQEMFKGDLGQMTVTVKLFADAEH